MEVATDDKKLKKILGDYKELEKKLNKNMMRSLKEKINQMEASDNFYEYLHEVGLGNPHSLSGNLNHLYSVHIDKTHRLIYEPVTESYSDDDLRKCKKVNLKGVCDYHGGKINKIIP